mgnify:CR=1 FL=1
MTVVEAITGGGKIDLSGSKSDVSPMLSSLLIEGIALNTNGSVYTPEVCLKYLCCFLGTLF